MAQDTGSSLAIWPTMVFVAISSAVGLTTTGCRKLVSPPRGPPVGIDIRVKRRRVVRISVDVAFDTPFVVVGKVELMGVLGLGVAIVLENARRCAAKPPEGVAAAVAVAAAAAAAEPADTGSEARH